jgi:hypothetical protein
MYEPENEIDTVIAFFIISCFIAFALFSGVVFLGYLAIKFLISNI